VRDARRATADSAAGRRRLVQPLGGIVLFVGALTLLVLLFAGIGTVTGSGLPVELPLSYPAGGWQPLCADANINAMMVNGEDPTLVGAHGTTSVGGVSNPLSVCVINATDRQHRMLMGLGWFVIAGSAVASFAHGVAGAYFLASAVTVPVPVRDDMLSALYGAVFGAPVLVGCAVLTLARIIRAGSLMRDDLEGTV
jgi:hypothetical protein